MNKMSQAPKLYPNTPHGDAAMKEDAEQFMHGRRFRSGQRVSIEGQEGRVLDYAIGHEDRTMDDRIKYDVNQNGNRYTVTKRYLTLDGQPAVVDVLEVCEPTQAQFWGIATDGTCYAIRGHGLALVSLNNLIEAQGKKVLQSCSKPMTMTWKAWTTKWMKRVLAAT